MKKYFALLLLLTACAGPDPIEPPRPIEPGPAIEEPAEPAVEEEGTFEYTTEEDYHGTLILTGYLDIQTRECPVGGMCENTVEYANFIFTETNDEDIYDFLGVNEGNSFAGGNRVGVGCYQEDQNRIFSENFGDESNVENIISGDDLSKLLASSEENQVKLKLTRPTYTTGRGAPDCYSHFRDFDVL